MICPHCEKSLLRKERPGNVCGMCGRRYALDPKTNPLRLHDLRVRRIAAQLTQNGQLPCTPGQLWYALARKSLRETQVETGCGIVLGVFGAIAFFIAVGSDVMAFGVIGGLLLLAALGFVVARVMGVGRGRPRLTRAEFRTGPLEEWKSVYGSLPPGVIDDKHYPSPDAVPPHGGTDPAPATPSDGLVLVCPDRSVAVFLDAAGLTARHRLTLVADPAALPAAPGTGPVLVLHDADARGLLLARRVRTAQPGRRVVDVGLPLGAVHGLARAVPVRGEPPGPIVMARLRDSGEFHRDQLKWLAKGWGFPLVGVPPAKLLAVVSRAVERAGAAADTRRRAADVGFLTWPQEGG
ncbi:hypothetical protein [Streptomyces sp. NPDC001508]|uniref:hypothetical protein n=1 Tax=Streptomyces sp. NPDC001508 TaxID=3154656 RepID=UPI003321F4A9